MKVVIESTILEKEGLSLQDFAVLLYYMGDGKGVLNSNLCEALWNKGLLKKTEEGYDIHPGKVDKIKNWIFESNNPPNIKERAANLAIKLRTIFPEGRKEGTNYYWRDSLSIITNRLVAFFSKYGDKFEDKGLISDENILKATSNYVSSFNGNYQYMQLLKYFIYKRIDGEENSQLLSYLENMGQENHDKDWTTNLV